MKVLEDTPAVLTLGKLCDEHGYSYEWINGQKPHLIKNGIRIQCNTENFVRIVVRGLSTSSSSSLPISTPMTPLRQEIDRSKSSSSSSTSTPMTFSTEIDHSDHPPAIVSSESVERQVRGDPCGIDHHRAAVSSKHVERQDRGDLCSSQISEEQLLTKPTKNPKPNKNENHEQVRRDPYFSETSEELLNVDRNTSHVIFLLHSAHTECVSHHMAQDRVCAHHPMSMVIHDERLSVCSLLLCSSLCSFPCVSPSPCSSLPTSTCTLTSTSSSMWTTPRQLTTGTPPNEEFCAWQNSLLPH